MQQHIIALIDCDCFYVSCERKDNISLQGKPVCVMTSNSDKGIIVSRSKEAKALGIKMGAPYFQVKHTHKNAICVPARLERYAQISNMVMEVIKTFSPDVEVVSVDEAYVDLTGLNKVYKTSYTQIIQNIRQCIWDKLQTPVSIGLSCSKPLSMLASDMAKNTGGIFVIRPDKIQEIIGDIKIEQICGIGHKNSLNLNYYGVFTVNDFLNKDNVWIKKVLGINGFNLKQELLGNATSLVNKNPVAPQSVQDTKSFEDFTDSLEFLQHSLNTHVHASCKKLRQWNGFCGGIEVMLRTKDFKILSIGTRFEKLTNSDFDITTSAQKLLQTIYRPNLVYRSVGITLKHLCYGKQVQQSLFEQTTPYDDKLLRVLDELDNKFGQGKVKIGM